MAIKLMNGLRRACGLHVYTVQIGEHDAGGAVPELPTVFSVRILTPEEVRSHVNEEYLDLRESSVNAALSRGDVSAGVFKDDKLVAYSWRAVRGPVSHSSDWEVIWRSGLVYRYKALTLPEYRGLHINEAVDKVIDRHLGALGYTTGLSFVDVTNLASQRTLARKARKRVGYAGHLRIGARQVAFRTPGCRAVGFAFRPTKAPRADTELSRTHVQPITSRVNGH